jgi:hypothetical protein
MPIRSRPAPTVQLRSKPVNGSELAFALAGLGALLDVADGVVFVGDGVDGGVLFAFDGDVPLFGVGGLVP